MIPRLDDQKFISTKRKLYLDALESLWHSSCCWRNLLKRRTGAAFHNLEMEDEEWSLKLEMYDDAPKAARQQEEDLSDAQEACEI
jgi:hypothetical protein